MNTTTLTQAKKSQIEIKVLSINTLYKYAAIIVKYEREHFSRFIGQNIFKVDGSIKQKYDHEKLTFDGFMEDGTHYNVHYWFNSRYSFDVKIRVCVNGGSYDVKPSTAFCQYDELNSTLFNLENNVLVATERDYSYLETVYNVEELTKTAKEIKLAGEAYRAASDKLPHQFADAFYIERLTRN